MKLKIHDERPNHVIMLVGDIQITVRHGAISVSRSHGDQVDLEELEYLKLNKTNTGERCIEHAINET